MGRFCEPSLLRLFLLFRLCLPDFCHVSVAFRLWSASNFLLIFRFALRLLNIGGVCAPFHSVRAGFVSSPSCKFSLRSLGVWLYCVLSDEPDFAFHEFHPKETLQ